MFYTLLIVNFLNILPYNSKIETIMKKRDIEYIDELFGELEDTIHGEISDRISIAREKIQTLYDTDVRISLPTTKELRDARGLYEMQVKSNSMLNKTISKHFQEGVEWMLNRVYY